ncbi:MAG: hypothetical protein IPN77_32195, partial [Sandaracinaceae bacterium]|nr:hypothetical protein [Sandaracinaceae bacterium]
MALRINHVYGEGTLVVPEAVIAEGPLVPSTDGSDRAAASNTLPLFADEGPAQDGHEDLQDHLRSLEAQDPVGSTVYELLLQLSPKDAAVLANAWRRWLQLGRREADAVRGHRRG